MLNNFNIKILKPKIYNLTNVLILNWYRKPGNSGKYIHFKSIINYSLNNKFYLIMPFKKQSN